MNYGAINLEGAWSWSKGDPNVVVQVLDTGIDMSHPDLQMNIWTNTGEICGNGIDDDNNGYGSANSGAKLMISVGFGKTATGGFAEALLYGADMGAQISSNSWGYTSPGFVSQAILDAIDYYNAVNGIVVFAAGNSNSEADYYPAFYSGTVAVSAVEDDGVRASFSNYGDWIEISAPGVSVYSTMLGTSYGYASGTSMACPHIAGVLALGKSFSPTIA